MNRGIEDKYRNAITCVLKGPTSSSKALNLVRRRKSIVKKGNAVALAKVAVGKISEGGWERAVPIRLYFFRGQNGVKVGKLCDMKYSSLQLARNVIERICFGADVSCSLHNR